MIKFYGSKTKTFELTINKNTLLFSCKWYLLATKKPSNNSLFDLFANLFIILKRTFKFLTQDRSFRIIFNPKNRATLIILNFRLTQVQGCLSLRIPWIYKRNYKILRWLSITLKDTFVQDRKNFIFINFKKLLIFYSNLKKKITMT